MDVDDIPWETAVDLLATGTVRSATQGHDLTVHLGTADGRTLRTREPHIDAIVHLVRALPDE